MDTGFDTDAALIERSFSTPEEFGGIYQRHGGAIAAFVLRRVDGGRSRAEDIVADVFVAAFRSRRKYDLGRPSCLPWLYGIARNVLRNEYRWWQRQKRLAISLPLEPDAADIADGPIGRVDARALLDTLHPKIRSLSEPEKLSLELLADGHSYREIAERLGCEVGTVKSRISRTRAKIADPEHRRSDDI